MDISCELVFDRSTKNTFRYLEVGEEDHEPIVGVLYVRKTAVGPTPPQKIVLSVTSVEEKQTPSSAELNEKA